MSSLRTLSKFKLPVILMSSDDREKFVLESLSCGVALYITEPSSEKEFQNLWHNRLATTKKANHQDVVKHVQKYCQRQKKVEQEKQSSMSVLVEFVKQCQRPKLFIRERSSQF